ncbi:collagen alpha-1(I) chain-like [Pungitius pungitius]|uniref:collagen alpha-1(I) chain-like n=1 Tax=Pungitius pungitius TaxID=134920 RepID=UPI002E14DA84
MASLPSSRPSPTGTFWRRSKPRRIGRPGCWSSWWPGQSRQHRHGSPGVRGGGAAQDVAGGRGAVLPGNVRGDGGGVRVAGGRMGDPPAATADRRGADGSPGSATRGEALPRDYAGVIMDRLGLSPEDHRRRFQEARLGPEDRPFAFAQRLRDAANRWLQPGGRGHPGGGPPGGSPRRTGRRQTPARATAASPHAAKEDPAAGRGVAPADAAITSPYQGG